MKNIFWFLLVGLFIAGCGSDEEDEHMHNDKEDTEFAYHAHINSPGTDTKILGETMHIHVVFESHTGETVHNVSVKMFNKADDSKVVYEFNEHVHATEGEYEHHADVEMTNDSNVEAHNDYIIEAKVWATEEGLSEAVETVEFHVHMN